VFQNLRFASLSEFETWGWLSKFHPRKHLMALLITILVPKTKKNTKILIFDILRIPSIKFRLSKFHPMATLVTILESRNQKKYSIETFFANLVWILNVLSVGAFLYMGKFQTKNVVLNDACIY
jgi:hypothetical protein